MRLEKKEKSFVAIGHNQQVYSSVSFTRAPSKPDSQETRQQEKRVVPVEKLGKILSFAT